MNRDKEFVPHQPSLDMKELGFDGECFGYFNVTKYLGIGSFVFKECNKNTIDGYGNHVLLRPTFSQAFRWFRDKYGMEGVTQRAEDFMWYKWTIHQYNKNGKKYVADWYEYNTYEEAELECLKKLIEIVKNK